MPGQVSFAYYRMEPVWFAVALINTTGTVGHDADPLADTSAAQVFLGGHEFPGEVSEADLVVLRELRSELCTVFAAADDLSAAARTNGLLDRYSAPPRIVHDVEQGLHLHFERPQQDFGRWVAAVTVMGIAFVLCEYGSERMGICALPHCGNAFIDSSKNRSKRYCAAGHAHQASTAAFRSRRRTRSAQAGPVFDRTTTDPVSEGREGAE